MAEPQKTTNAVDLDDTMAAWVTTLREIRAQIAERTEIEKRIVGILKGHLGDAEEARIDGHPVIRYRQVTSRRLDQSKLKENHPDIVEAFTTPTLSRRFELLPRDDT